MNFKKTVKTLDGFFVYPLTVIANNRGGGCKVKEEFIINVFYMSEKNRAETGQSSSLESALDQILKLSTMDKAFEAKRNKLRKKIADVYEQNKPSLLTAENYQLIKKLLEVSGGHFGDADTSELFHRVSKISSEVKKIVTDFIKEKIPETASVRLGTYMSNDPKNNTTIIFSTKSGYIKDKNGYEITRYSILPNMDITTSVVFEPYKEEKKHF